MLKRVAFASLVVALSASLAWAYIPPSSFLIKMVSRKHSGYKSVEVQTQVSSMEGGKVGSTRFKDVTLFVPSTGMLKSWALDSNGATLYYVERAPKEVLPASGVLLDSHPVRLSQSLADAGVPVIINPLSADTGNAPGKTDTQPATADPEKTSLARLDGAIAWVIGGDAGTPQLWIEKDAFLPIRLALPSADIRMERYRFFEDFPYPQDTTLSEPSKNGTASSPLLRSELLSVRVDDPSTLPKDEAAIGLTEAGNAAPSELRDLLKTYYRYIR